MNIEREIDPRAKHAVRVDTDIFPNRLAVYCRNTRASFIFAVAPCGQLNSRAPDSRHLRSRQNEIAMNTTRTRIPDREGIIRSFVALKANNYTRRE